MKIGFLVGKVSFGGGERVVKTLIREMYKLGHTVFIYSWEDEWNLERKTCPYNISVLEYPPIGLLGKFSAFNAFRSSLKVDKPDCVIIFSLPLAEVGVFSAKALQIPVVLTERVDPVYLPTVKIHRILKKVVFLIADKIVFQTENVLQYFSKGIQKNGVVIPNMLMDDYSFEVETTTEVKEILAVGRLSEEKNFQMLIKAFAAAKLDDYTLRILGDGPSRKELEMMISELNMEGQIILEGMVDSTLPYYRKADIFVLTSNHEGMPNALMEAMASGLACISTDFRSGGARALIENGVSGILIPLNDIDALKEKLLFLVTNPKVKSKLKRNAASAIRNNNNRELILQKWVQLIKSLVYDKK